MADENQEVVVENQEQNTEAQSSEPQYTETELRAMEQGWVPKDQYSGPNKWRDAEDFLDRGELFKKLDQQNKRLSTYDQTLQDLKKHHEKVRETEYKRALATLREEKKAALNDGDADAVVDIDDRIAELREEAKRVETAPAVNTNVEPDPRFMIWVNKNPWYNNDKAMKVYADEVGQKMALSGANPQEILMEVERRVKREFPERFNNPNRDKPGAVEGGTSKSGGRKESFTLTSEETRAMHRFVNAGVLTKEQYIAEIKASRGE